MHKQLEDYLTEVGRQLSSLPKPRFDDELNEMRQHILSAVIANQELGQSEETAVANAIEKFGTPEEVVTNVLWAWRRHLWQVNKKLFSKMAGIWSLFYVFTLLTSAHTPSQQGRVFLFWASTITVFALFMLVPHYFRMRTQSPLPSSL